MIFWWKTRSGAEKRRPRSHVNGCYSSISLYSIDNWNNWAVVVVKYDPMICCVLHARAHPAERHQPSPPGNIKTRNDTSDAKYTAFYWQTIIIKSLSVIKMHCSFRKKDQTMTSLYITAHNHAKRSAKAPFTLCWQLARNVVAKDGYGGLPPHFYPHNFLLNQVCTMYFLYRRYSQ